MNTLFLPQGFELPEKKYDELNTTWIKRLNEAKRDYNFRITVKPPQQPKVKHYNKVVFLLDFDREVPIHHPWPQRRQRFSSRCTQSNGNGQVIKSCIQVFSKLTLVFSQFSTHQRSVDGDPSPVYLSEVSRVLPKQKSPVECLSGRRDEGVEDHRHLPQLFRTGEFEISCLFCNFAVFIL